ncbi:MAG: N-acetylglucosamine-6-phosphate deacetylase [Clostridia bacterium]
MSTTVIRNGKLVTPHRVIDGGCVVYEKDKILYAGKDDPGISADVEMDAHGLYVSPGFIDIHVHGGGGSDFMDGTPEDFITACTTHARYGTTALFPTTTSSDVAGVEATFDAYRKARAMEYMGARMEGIHLEGPYFSMEQRGAQDPGHIRPLIAAEYEKIMSMSSDIRRWSIAPELEGSGAFAQKCLENKILPAIGHSNAIYEEVLQAYSDGFRLITHLYSGCSMVRRINAYRYAGVVESAFLIEDMNVEVIADGHHLPASLLKLILKNKAFSRIALITDATRAAGLDVTEAVVGSREGGIRAIIEDGVAKLPDRSAFAGSVATCDRLVRVMMEQAGVPLHRAVEMMTASPARVMGIYRRTGSLAAGKCADIAIFDGDIRMHAVVVGGKTVFREDASI